MWNIKILFSLHCAVLEGRGPERGQHHDHDQREVRRRDPQQPHAAPRQHGRGGYA